MGRLYTKSFMNEETIGYFSNGTVTRGNGGIFSDNSVAVHYQGGWIYVNSMNGGWHNHTVAKCDEYGNIYAGNGGGNVLAKCENGIVYNGNHYGKKEIARYEGDMYGAAAAVAALMLGLADSPSSVHSTGRQSGDSAPSHGTSQQSGSSAQSDDTTGCLGAIFTGIVFLITLPFKLIKLLFKLLWAIVSAPSLSLLGGIFLALLSIGNTPVFDVFELFGLNIEIFEAWTANESIFVPLVNVIPALFPIIGGIYLPRLCAKSGLPEHSIRKTAFLHNLLFLLVPLYDILYNITNPIVAHTYVMFLILVSPFVTLITISSIKRKIKKMTPKHKKEKKSKKKKQQTQESEED